MAALWVGSAGVLILGLQPVLLGALLSEKRVDFDQLALTATLEILAVGVGSVVAAFAINARYLRVKASLLLLAVALFDFLTASASSPGAILLWRSIAGLVEGGLVAFAVELIARSRYPGRYGGYFILMQTVAQSIMAAFLALYVVKNFGSYGGFLVVAVVCALSTISTIWMPREYGPLPKPENTHNAGLLRLAPILALAVIFTFCMFFGAVWAFLEPLAAEAGINAQTAGFMVSISLAAQVAGATTATFLESRLPHSTTLTAAAVVAAIIAAAFTMQPNLAIFWLLAMALGFVWLFVIPFQIRLTVAADSTRSAALLVPAAQLLGSALGPALGSLFISGNTVTPIAWFACCSAVSSALLCIVFILVNRQKHSEVRHA